MRTLRGRVVQLEAELQKLRVEPVTVVVEKPKVKALPEPIDQGEPDSIDEQAETDEDFRRMLDLEPDNGQAYRDVWNH